VPGARSTPLALDGTAAALVRPAARYPIPVAARLQDQGKRTAKY
jgi:hypothetical protein